VIVASNRIPNSYIFILATTGIVGVLLYLVLGVYFLREVIYRMKQEKGNTYMGGAILASICTILVQSFFENSFFYTPFVLWMILVFGIFFNKSSDLKK
jgi:O-antigen ligase